MKLSKWRRSRVGIPSISIWYHSKLLAVLCITAPHSTNRWVGPPPSLHIILYSNPKMFPEYNAPIGTFFMFLTYFFTQPEACSWSYPVLNSQDSLACLSRRILSHRLTLLAFRTFLSISLKWASARPQKDSGLMREYWSHSRKCVCTYISIYSYEYFAHLVKFF